jgi:hypothetical protein
MGCTVMARMHSAFTAVKRSHKCHHQTNGSDSMRLCTHVAGGTLVFQQQCMDPEYGVPDRVGS